jgi:acetyl/propionyl-CoA carboxylase alpha subunit
LLIANRGEAAIRIARTAADMQIPTVAVHSLDDAQSLHVRAADAAAALQASGPAAYLDAGEIVRLAVEHGCDAVHPGYGFLSESAEFARRCAEAGLRFVGPAPDTLELFGDKAAARRFARECGMPVLPGFDAPVTAEEARGFFEGMGPGGAVMLKAVAGGGGRGMRPVHRLEDLEAAFELCSSEALSAFGCGDLYIEALWPRARHVEVQVVGDGSGAVAHLWDRECSLQRQRQKLIEIAPAFGLGEDLRQRMLSAAVALAARARYRGLGTIEFLVDARADEPPAFVFMEANPRLQVEHTVTEEVLGLDLVRTQLRIAEGATLVDLGLEQGRIGAPRGVALQLRVNLESMSPDGTSRPSGGVLAAYDPPTGPGVRVDGFGYTGYATSPRFDSLLAKVIVQGPDLMAAVARARRALSEFRILGAATNIPFLQALLGSDALSPNELHTRFVEENIADLQRHGSERPRHFVPESSPDARRAGAQVDLDDPLAVLSVRPGAAQPQAVFAAPDVIGPPGTEAVASPLQGTLTAITAFAGDLVREGQPVAVMEALKMEHLVVAPVSGVVREVALDVGAAVFEGAPILFIEPAEVEGGPHREETDLDLDADRPDLARVRRLHALTTDEMRAQAAEKRRAQRKRTARENLADLCDPGSFMEYGPIVTATRLMGESPEEVDQRVLKTPADGIVMGVGRVNGELFGPERSRCIALSYDYSVMAGTQGGKNHQKTDRMLDLAERYRLPVVFFTEGGGGRMGAGGGEGGGRQVATTTGGLKVGTWRALGKLSGHVPLVGVTSGRCFAGNAVVLALMDVIIATRDSTIGVGGPAMIEGGGLGVYAPEEVGPISIQEPNGVVDLVVEEEAEATQAAKRYLSYFQGRVERWTAPDQRLLRHLVPENRRAVFDVRKVIETIADEGSVMELRRGFGAAMVTAFVRVEGRPLGVIANNSNSPTGGAVDSDAADKAARFMQLCDAFDIPVATLLDVPGNMVGPEAEKTATIRHCGRLYVIGANLSVPFFSVVLRKAYGLGALAMSGGSFDNPFFTVSWPTGEFAGMGIEGSIKLGRRAELQAISDIPARKARYEDLVARAYDWASAVNGATVFEFDDVIDPADTRRWLAMGLEAAPRRLGAAHAKKRPWVDTW